MNNTESMQMEKIKKYCDIHHTYYQANCAQLNSREIVEPCPDCKLMTSLIQENELNQQRLERSQAKIKRLFKKSQIPLRYTTRTFENYHCITSEQSGALKMAQDYSSNIKENINAGIGLILSGGVGTGKTHLACAIGNEYVKKGTVLFITVSAMIRKIRETYRQDSHKTEQQALDELRDIDLLIIDEIGVQRGTKEEENLLFEVLNDRYAYFKPTILISNLNIDDITLFLGERSIDRMKENGGGLIQMNWASYRSQVASNEQLPNNDKAKY